jgi:hypothetical protein
VSSLPIAIFKQHYYNSQGTDSLPTSALYPLLDLRFSHYGGSDHVLLAARHQDSFGIDRDRRLRGSLHRVVPCVTIGLPRRSWVYPDLEVHGRLDLRLPALGMAAKNHCRGKEIHQDSVDGPIVILVASEWSVTARSRYCRFHCGDGLLHMLSSRVNAQTSGNI